MKWMLFVDGENLTIQGQKLAELRGLQLETGRHFSRNVFLWMPGIHPREMWPKSLLVNALRAHYYTSVAGDEPRVNEVRSALRQLGFDPEVFKKEAQKEKAKGVDIALTKDVLAGAFFNNYEIAVLIAGDGDYLPLIREVKRLGKLFYVAFFAREGLGLNPEMRIVADDFVDLEQDFSGAWTNELARLTRGREGRA
jgi:uncharacterized LabA/DUF88 family protein